jgi:hypothetical protein
MRSAETSSPIAEWSWTLQVLLLLYTLNTQLMECIIDAHTKYKILFTPTLGSLENITELAKPEGTVCIAM